MDKHDKRRALLWVQALLTVQALALAALTWLGWVSPWLLVAMSGLLGVLNSFDAPLRQSLIGSFVGRREDLPNALALNAMLFNAAALSAMPARCWRPLSEGGVFCAERADFFWR